MTHDILIRGGLLLDGTDAAGRLGDLAIRDGLDLQRMHLAEIGDLGERQGSLLDQPYCGGFGHQREAHAVLILLARAMRGGQGNLIFGNALVWTPASPRVKSVRHVGP